jgi:AraC family L-rhamnose operon transcriptional activator RhaR/AraC family L-rhamnose operon regulatory protein RhaS
MGSFIVGRRIDDAQMLLATTDLQIKRIALRTGHANEAWFSHLFRVHTGITPTAYRRQSRRASM